MKRITSLLATLAVATSLTFTSVTAHAETALDRILSAKKIVIGVQNDVPPYSQIGADNQVEGMDIDIAKAIAKDLGVKLEMVTVSGSNRIPMLTSGRADMIIATVGINPQRAAAVALSIPYTAFPMVLIAPKDKKIGSYADTKGMVIGLTRGTMQDEIVSRNAPDATIRRYDDDATTIQALATNQIDATAFGTSVAEDLMKRFPNLNLEQKFNAFSVYAGIAVRRTDPDLLQWVNTWIFYNKNNGFLDEMHKKWLKTPLGSLPTY